MDFDPSQLASALRKDEIDIGDLPNSQGGSFMTGIANALKSGFTLPGDVATGKVDPMSDEGIARAQDMAGLAMTGGLAGTGEAGAAVGSGPIRAYHGSPHDFDRFDLSKIGTGEGAQVFGHGLYFAENPKVADQYRLALAGPDQARDVATKLGPLGEALPKLAQTDPTGYQGALEYHIRQAYKPPATANEAIRSELERTIANYQGGHIPMDERGLSDARAALHFLDNYGPEVIPAKRAGKMYEVAIHADPERFLDWDKPLAGQSEYVRSVMNDPGKLGLEPRQGVNKDGSAYSGWMDPATGKTIGGLNMRRYSDTPPALPSRLFSDNEAGPLLYKAGGSLKGPEATDLLNRAGIPGIKYLDQGSRAAGDGSRNFVTFDDKIVEILKKYGVASMAALPPAVQMMLLPNDHPRDGAQE